MINTDSGKYSHQLWSSCANYSTTGSEQIEYKHKSLDGGDWFVGFKELNKVSDKSIR
jgi:hypothetical protein